jgi:hypothetical protein
MKGNQMHFLKAAVVAPVIVAVLSGCYPFGTGGGKNHDQRTDLSDGDIRHGIQKALNKNNPACIAVTAFGFPRMLEDSADNKNVEEHKMLNALASAGVLKATKGVFRSPIRKNFGAESDMVNGTEYSLTEIGVAELVEKLPSSNRIPQGGSGFCVGEIEVVDIVEHSKPAYALGGSYITVRYEYKFKPKQWASQLVASVLVPDLVGDDKKTFMVLERGVYEWRRRIVGGEMTAPAS